MPEPASPDHDQRLKVLLKELFEQFFLCFFPAWADRFDFAVVEWLDKVLFLGSYARPLMPISTIASLLSAMLLVDPQKDVPPVVEHRALGQATQGEALRMRT